MNFPSIWINWIYPCISYVLFFFLNNKQPSSWISSSWGIRQGDPLSSYLFIIISQNFSAILNFSLNGQIIMCFNSNLNSNFNHLMYTDDLILISLASRKVASNTILCLHIYQQHVGQNANKLKSAINFPNRFNLRLKRSISNIIAFNTGSFSFKYLGVQISPRNIAISQF